MSSTHLRLNYNEERIYVVIQANLFLFAVLRLRKDTAYQVSVNDRLGGNIVQKAQA